MLSVFFIVLLVKVSNVVFLTNIFSVVVNLMLPIWIKSNPSFYVLVITILLSYLWSSDLLSFLFLSSLFSSFLSSGILLLSLSDLLSCYESSNGYLFGSSLLYYLFTSGDLFFSFNFSTAFLPFNIYINWYIAFSLASYFLSFLSLTILYLPLSSSVTKFLCLLYTTRLFSSTTSTISLSPTIYSRSYVYFLSLSIWFLNNSRSSDEYISKMLTWYTYTNVSMSFLMSLRSLAINALNIGSLILSLYLVTFSKVSMRLLIFNTLFSVDSYILWVETWYCYFQIDIYHYYKKRIRHYSLAIISWCFDM